MYPDAFDDFDDIFKNDRGSQSFYDELQKGIQSEDEKLVQRQAFAGMLWSKQFYYYDVHQWLKGDPANLRHLHHERTAAIMNGHI